MKRIVLATVTVTALAAAVPAFAATPTFNGTVGPGFTITMAKKPTKAGKIKLVVADKSSSTTSTSRARASTSRRASAPPARRRSR